MKLLIFLLDLPQKLVLGPWAWLWGWTYPLARPSIDEVRSNATRGVLTGSVLVEAVRLFFTIPFMARSQHYAERSTDTLTIVDSLNASPPAHLVHMERWRAEPAWRSRFREVLVWATLASWLISWGSIEVSFIATGNFLFETHATTTAEGYVTNYFKVTALAFLAPLAWLVSGALVLGVTRRAN